MNQSSTLKKTALSEAHPRYGARMVEFGGWWMPVQYSSILEEHQAVRQTCGLFDISHMGEVLVSGSGATQWLESLLASDVQKIQPGQGQYSFLLNDQGGVIDDLIYYRMDESTYFLVINASKIDEDVAWMRAHLPKDNSVRFDHQSDALSGLALQGPQAASLLSLFLGMDLATLPKRNRILTLKWNEAPLFVARTGYTGEDGFELFVPNAQAEPLWDALLKSGHAFGLKPCGLGCRDTLRLEACLPLNGNDLSADRTPIEADLARFTAPHKLTDFPGKKKLLEQIEKGSAQKLVAFKALGKGAPPRSHYALYQGSNRVGEVSSGTLSPTLGIGIGLGYVDAAFASVGTKLEMEVRGNRVAIEVCSKPFYKRS